jgi:hypothetical protein
MNAEQFESLSLDERIAHNLSQMSPRARAVIGGAGYSMVANNAIQTNEPVNEEPLPVHANADYKGQGEVKENNDGHDSDVLAMPKMTFGSVRRPAVKTGPIQNTDDDGVLPLPSMKFD